MIEEQIKTLKQRVEYILNLIPETRNSDKRLTIEIWKEYYEGFLCWDKDSEQWMVCLEDVMDLPSQDGIKRVRAVIQNDEHRLVPTSQTVATARGWNIIKWKQALGYNTDSPNQIKWL